MATWTFEAWLCIIYLIVEVSKRWVIASYAELGYFRQIGWKQASGMAISLVSKIDMHVYE